MLWGSSQQLKRILEARVGMPIKRIFDRLFLEFWVFAEDSTQRIERFSKLLLEKLVYFSDALGLGLHLPVF